MSDLTDYRFERKMFFLWQKKIFWTAFVKNHHFCRRTKFLTLVFFQGKSKNHKKLLYQRKEGMFIVKFKKFGVDWYIPYEMAADSDVLGLRISTYNRLSMSLYHQK